ncbi:MAG: hypothetical protein ACK5NB_06340 [Flavobacteriaceae bacterium]
MNNRFSDNGEILRDFGNYRIVECPNCLKPIDYHPPRLVCTHCGYNKEFKKQNMLYQIYPETSIELKDYLINSCCKHNFWAQNLEHLIFLEDYVKAKLRERKPNRNKSVASRLPIWMKDAKNRDEILKAINGLKTKLEKNGYRKTLPNKV